MTSADYPGASPDQWALLAAHVEARLEGVDPEAAAFVRRQCSAPDGFRVISEMDLDDDDQPDLTSVHYRVDIRTPDGWVGVALVPWAELGLTLDDCETEVRNILAQREMGITVPAWAGDE